jgi:transposase
MWTSEHRRAADRHGVRYPSDLSDGEWALIEPMIPPARHGGRKRSINVREVLNIDEKGRRPWCATAQSSGTKMKKYFADRIQAETGETSKQTAPRQKRRRAVATASKLRRVKSKAKASKNKLRRRVAASAKARRAKKTDRKLVKLKRRR